MTIPTPGWTTSQSEAIRTRGKGVVVSAAAGSGKTSVLAERCASLVCDGPDRCDITELLVVTFTNLAADEMRHRIGQAIERRVLESPADTHIRRQRSLIDRARISTIDAFYFALIRRNFNRLGIDPASQTLGEDQASLLRLDVSRRVVEQACDSDADCADLVRFYFGDDDHQLADAISRMHARIASLDHREQWLERAQAELIAACDNDKFLRTQGVLAMLKHARTLTGQACETFDQLLAEVDLFDRDHKYVGHFQQLVPLFDQLRAWALLGDANLVEASIPNIVFGRLPNQSKAEQTTRHGLIKSLLDKVKSIVSELSVLRISRRQLLGDAESALAPGQAVLRLVELFDRQYTLEKTSRRAIDFDDGARMTLKLLTESGQAGQGPSAIALELNREFKHVLVDESQDLSPIQDRILSLVSTDFRSRVEEGTASNLFSVGDVKQSIYRFRLAEPEVFLNRLSRAASHVTPDAAIYLQENFRTRSGLIAALNPIFARLMSYDISGLEYDSTQQLVAGFGYPPDATGAAFNPTTIDLCLVQKAPDAEESAAPKTGNPPNETELQAKEIARQIRTLFEDGRVVYDKSVDGYRPIGYSDIAVLLRVAKDKSAKIARVLRDSGIPVRASDKSGFFNSIEVSDVMALLEVLDNRYRDAALAAVLRSPLAAIDQPDELLARIRLDYPQHDIGFAQAAISFAAESDTPMAKSLRGVFARLERWREQARLGNTPELIDNVYRDTGVIEFNRALPGGAQRVANLLELRDHARRFEAGTTPSLGRFVEHLYNLADDENTRRPEVVDADSQQVQILTIHASKGLEFPVVFVPDLQVDPMRNTKIRPVDAHRDLYLSVEAIDRDRGVRYPSAGAIAVFNDQRRQTLAETVNQLYVAFTRAREHLVLLAYDKTGRSESESEPAVGPLSSRDMIAAKTPLNWLLAVAEAEPKSLRVVPVVVAGGASSVGGADQDETSRLLRERIARCEPLPGISDGEVGSLFHNNYAFESLTRTSSTRAASALSHKFSPAASADRQPLSVVPVQNEKPILAMPGFMQEYTPAPTAADIGTAVHRFIELIDLSDSLDADGLARQGQVMVARRLMTSAEIDMLDLGSIEWMFTTEVGMLMTRGAGRLYRELPISFAIESEPGIDANDRVLVRGRIDALVELPEGLVVIDYKTDRVRGMMLKQQAEYHQQQLRLYDQALANATGLAVVRRVLVFLEARECVDV